MDVAADTGLAAAKQLRRTVADYLPWAVRAAPLGLLGVFMSDENFLKQAVEYQPSVDALLRWLCSAPKSSERESLRMQAFGFLREHTEHIGGVHLVEVEYSEPKLDDPEAPAESMKYWSRDGKVKDESPLGVYKVCRDYRDLADPICEFVSNEHQKFRDGGYKKPIPIFVCPSCNKLVMPERVGKKQFCSSCSDQARAERYRKKAPPDELRDYQYLRRLKVDLQGEKPAVRTMRLKNPHIRRRVNQIKKRMQTSPRCQNLVREMKL